MVSRIFYGSARYSTPRGHSSWRQSWITRISGAAASCLNEQRLCDGAHAVSRCARSR